MSSHTLDAPPLTSRNPAFGGQLLAHRVPPDGQIIIVLTRERLQTYLKWTHLCDAPESVPDAPESVLGYAEGGYRDSAA